MAKTNIPRAPIRTHEGAKAQHVGAEAQLRRSVMACMLWEDTFYEEGVKIADRIADLVPKVKPVIVYGLAIEARTRMKLRHVPLLLAREMSRIDSHKHLVAELLPAIIQRADELTEFLGIYWKDRKQPLSAQVKKGLAAAFRKFDEYQLAKYNRDAAVKLRDVLFLSHAKPKNDEQAALWKRLVEGNLATPDTWETTLSAGGSQKTAEDKRAHWTRLLDENKLGPLALLRNLRNMSEVGVDEDKVRAALESMKTERILPFRFVSAARYAPQWEPYIEQAMFRCTKDLERLPGKTALVVDASGSMQRHISGKSELTCFDAAAAVAILLRELCDQCAVVVFSYGAKAVPARRGFALRDAMIKAAEWSGTNTERGITEAKKNGYDRIIVISDEQSHTSISSPEYNRGEKKKGYFINVAAYQNGIGYGAWNHIDGWSEAVIDYIREYEKQ